ncbi:MAG: type I methionyl aminopeptidase [Fibrobacteres bacterium]|nr:type I methionyl aminopeptidase [Fibrobacterota bacterium]
MTVRNRFDIEALRRVGQVVAETLELMKAAMEEGIETRELDAIAARNFARHGAVSAPRKTYRFPGETCISVNEAIAHGIPGGRRIRKGDLINLDVSAELDGYYADTGYTVAFESDDEELAKLCDCSRRALRKAIAQARPGRKLSHIGRAIENEARANGFAVIRNLTGHGTGGALHEYPDEIRNYYDPRQQGALAKGMVVAIETFVSTGAEWAEETGDGWTLTTEDGSRVAQYEHTLIVTEGEPIITTRLGG